MAIDFSQIGATPAHTGKVDFSALGAVPAVGSEEPTEETTALGAVGRGAVGMIPLGTQAYAATAGAMESKPYLQERQELEKEIKSDIESHPVARLAGQAAGVVAPALVTGGSSVPESLAGALGQGAAIGAGFGAGNAIDTLAGGGSGAEAAKEIALGAGLGTAGGAIGHGLGHLAEEAVPKLEGIATRKAAQAVGMGSDELGNMTPTELSSLGQTLLDKNIVGPGKSTQEMFDTAKGLHEQYGQKIGQIGNQATELGLTTDTKPLLDALGDKYNAATQLNNPDEVRNALWYKRGMADIMAMARQNGAERVGPDIAESQMAPSFVTFDQLQKLKKSYGNSAFENGAVKNPAAADVYGQLSAGQKAIVDKAAGNTDLPAELRDAMTGYSKLYPVVDGLQDVLGRERAGNIQAKGFGMMGKMVGQLPGQDKPLVNALTSLGLIGMGHPMWGMGAATATLQNPRAMASLAQGTARAIPEVTGHLPSALSQITGVEAPGPVVHGAAERAVEHGIHHTADEAIRQSDKNSPTSFNVNHPALAPWKQVFDRNASTANNAGEIQKSQAVTDFVLSQRDPAYAAAKQKVSDNPEPEDTVKMAKGGVILSSAAPVKKSIPMEDLPANSTQKIHQPFNSDLADKLKAFLNSQKEGNSAESR